MFFAKGPCSKSLWRGAPSSPHPGLARSRGSESIDLGWSLGICTVNSKFAGYFCCPVAHRPHSRRLTLESVVRPFGGGHHAASWKEGWIFVYPLTDTLTSVDTYCVSYPMLGPLGATEMLLPQGTLAVSW